MSEPLNIFRYLTELARRSRGGSGNLTTIQDASDSLWSGVGFSVDGHRCVAPMGEIVEVLTEPVATRLPGVKSWIKGVANVRGRLLPLLDLNAFLERGAVQQRSSRRVLVVEHGDIYIGLIVDEVFGMQHFQLDAFQHDSENFPPSLQRYIDGHYKQGDTQWALFRPPYLIEDEDFYNVAA
ncbi:MAG: chemotaxis protein CheW [Spongiibacter sp.]|nr:chemotaxis protein CheW [Spongiibacter sp.]